jgi:hypothetical protein
MSNAFGAACYLQFVLIFSHSFSLLYPLEQMGKLAAKFIYGSFIFMK